MERPNYYAVLPANVRYDKQLRPAARLLYAEITALCNKSGYCSAGNAYFAELYDASIKTVQGWITQLVKGGYISVEVLRDQSGQVTGRRIWIAGNPALPLLKNEVTSPENRGDPHLNFKEYYNRKNITSKNNTPIVPKGDDGLFDEFWSAYPKHVAKQPARRAFDRLKPDRALLDKMLAALQWQTQSEQWTKDGARYVPNPATWLNAHRWEDEPEGSPTPSTLPERKEDAYTWL